MSLRIGRFFGINLNIHWSFWLLPLWVIATHAQEPEGISLAIRLTLLAALFCCVVLHEYGHALMARWFGIATRDVTLYPIGGVARLERMGEKPWEEFCIAIAGPVVNLVIAAGLGLGLMTAFAIQPGLVQGPAGDFLFLLVAMNVVLFLFNLLPAFPMDGGRVLRALLTVPLGRLRATRAAVLVGTGIAVAGGLGGMLFWHNPWLLLVGLFVIWAGHQELYALEVRAMRDAEPYGPKISPDQTVPSWHGTAGETITVYLWDPRRHAWIIQGAIPAHGFTSRGPRAI
jgi:Zn-dependent protease